MNYSAPKKRSDTGSHEVSWFENGKRGRKSFKTQDAALRWTRAQKQIADLGVSPAEVNSSARLIAGTGFDMDLVIKAGLEQLRGIGAHRADATMTFKQAALAVEERAVKRGARARTIENYKAISSLLCKKWDVRIAVSITATEVSDHLAQLPDVKGGPGNASRATKETHLMFIRMVQKIAGVAKPLENVILPKEDRQVKYFSLDEVKTFLAATPEAHRGFVAVALWSCVRPENLENLPAEMVSAEAKTIRIPNNISKDRLTHVITDLAPPVLWKWLKKYPYQPTGREALQRRLRRSIGRWIQDGLRHTGATYYCALHGVNATARLLTHESESIVRKNYAGVVLDNKIAREFMELTPDKIKFLKSNKRVWPTDIELADMLQKHTGLKIAAKLGCSSSALSKHCRNRGIKQVGRGFWGTGQL